MKQARRLSLDLGPHLMLESLQTQEMLCDELVMSTRASVVVDADGVLYEKTNALKRAQGFKVLQVGAGTDSIDPFSLLATCSPRQRVERMTSALLGVEPGSFARDMSLEWDMTSFALLLTMFLEPERSVETLRALLRDPTCLEERLRSVERLGLAALMEHTERVYQRMCSVPFMEVKRACERALTMCAGDWPDRTTCVFAGLHDPSHAPTVLYLRGSGSTAEQGPLRMCLTGLLEGFGTLHCPGAVFVARSHRIRRLCALASLLTPPINSDLHVLVSARSVSTFAVAMGLGGERALSGLRGVVFTAPMSAHELENICIRLGHEHHYLALRRVPEGQVVVVSGDALDIYPNFRQLRTP